MAHLESLVILDASGRSEAALSFGFERAGYRVYATKAPDDAFAMAQTRVPQLVVVAVEGGESLSLVGRLREEAPTRELPVVGVGEHGLREEALRAGVDDFVTRPAFIRDVLTLSRLAVALRQDGDDGGVVGLLEDYGLYFLVRALAVAGRSGVLELERTRRIGEVHFVKGAVVAARVGKMSGVQAFHHLLLWGEASMSLRFESPAAERRIAMGVDELLASGAAFAQEFEQLAERVGGAQALYVHEPRRAAEVRSTIPAEVMPLVKNYDGTKPLIDIVEDSPFKPFDTIKITFRLAEMGAITRRETRDATPLSAQLAVRDWLLSGGADGGAATAGEGAAFEMEMELHGVAEAVAQQVAPVEAVSAPAATATATSADDLMADVDAMYAARGTQAATAPAATAPAATEAEAGAGTGTPVPVEPEKATAVPVAIEPAVAAQSAIVRPDPAPSATRPVPKGGQVRKGKKGKKNRKHGTPPGVTVRPVSQPSPSAAPSAAAKPAATTPAPATKPAAAASPTPVAASLTPAVASPTPAVASPTPAVASPTPAVAATKPAAAAASAAPAVAANVPSAAPAAASKPAAAAPAASQPAKLSAQAAARAHTKEPVFDAVEEEFFARESEHLQPPEHPVDDFADLHDPDPRRKLSTRRNWFGFRKK